MKRINTSYLLASLALITLLSISIFAGTDLSTRKEEYAAVAVLHDTIIKQYNPYRAIQKMITGRPAWTEAITQYLKGKNHDLYMRMLVTLPNKRDKAFVYHDFFNESSIYDAIAAYHGFLNTFAAHCQQDNIASQRAADEIMVMEFRAETATEGRAYPANGFHFNTFSGHPTLVEYENIVTIPDYRTWHVIDTAGNRTPERYVMIRAIIEKPKAESNYYVIDLEFRASK